MTDSNMGIINWLNTEDERRDAAVLLMPRLDYESRLIAVVGLLDSHRQAEKKIEARIKKMESLARRTPGEHAVYMWIEKVHQSIYQDAAHSMAAVGMIAPLIESVFDHTFQEIGRLAIGLPPLTTHYRLQTVKRETWDCRLVLNKDGKWSPSLVQGVVQLLDAIDLKAHLPEALAEKLAPTLSFPPPALRTRRADFRHRALQWNHAARTRAFRLRPAGGSCEPWHPAHTLALAGRCVVRPVDALTTATARVVPFAYACDDVWHSCSFIGVIGRSATPGACSLSPSLPPEAPSLGRHCPASTVVRASPPPWPARPCPHGSSVGACHAAGRASRVASIPLFHACCRHYPGGTGRCSRRSLPDRWQPSPCSRRVGFRIIRFEACAAFNSLYGGGREPGYPGPPAQIRTCALAHTAPTLGG